MADDAAQAALTGVPARAPASTYPEGTILATAVDAYLADASVFGRWRGTGFETPGTDEWMDRRIRDLTGTPGPLLVLRYGKGAQHG